MKILTKCTMCALFLLLAGCSLAGSRAASLPYDAWYLGFQAPSYMEVWLETADVQDTRDDLFPGAMAGTVSIGYSGDAAGWGKHITMGAGRDVTGAALPKRIYVRWQSLVEPQTYRAVLNIPESARQLMRSKAPSRSEPTIYEYRQVLTIGLAPGGWIKAWVKSPTSMPVEILCQKAEIEPKGPDLGEYGGQYVTLNPKAADYLKTHSIPYDSWKCPGAH